jgi:release factor glutamine methyltransferase
MNVADLLARARGQVDGVDADSLLAHALGKDRSWLFAHAVDVVPAELMASFESMLQRRIAGEPVAYLTGRQGFWTLDLEVGPATLIPRPETEFLVELALARIPVDAAVRVADLGTGSGAVALAIASERPKSRVIATDASTAALDVAQRNAARHDIGNIEFRCGDWFAPLQGEAFDIIASNPPYIADGDPHLDKGDVRFEPAMALSCGPDGLNAIRTIVGHAGAHLDAGGWLLLEHGWDQGEVVRGMLAAAGFIDVETVLDLEDRDRISLGRRC